MGKCRRHLFLPLSVFCWDIFEATCQTAFNLGSMEIKAHAEEKIQSLVHRFCYTASSPIIPYIYSFPVLNFIQGGIKKKS